MRDYKIQTYVTKENADKDGIISGYIGNTFYCLSKVKSKQFQTNILVYQYTIMSGPQTSISGEFFRIDDAINHLNNFLNEKFRSKPAEEVQKEYEREKNLSGMLG